jgi:hypothetical protein
MSDLFADVAGRKRIEVPEVADGFWIECRNELSVGEQRAIFSKAFKGQVPLEDGTFRNEYDMGEISFGKVIAYLVDWSDKAPVSGAAVRAMRPRFYGPIEAAVEKHIEELEKNSESAPKKGRRAPTTVVAA